MKCQCNNIYSTLKQLLHSKIYSSDNKMTIKPTTALVVSIATHVYTYISKAIV